MYDLKQTKKDYYFLTSTCPLTIPFKSYITWSKIPIPFCIFSIWCRRYSVITTICLSINLWRDICIRWGRRSRCSSSFCCGSCSNCSRRWNWCCCVTWLITSERTFCISTFIWQYTVMSTKYTFIIIC